MDTENVTDLAVTKDLFQVSEVSSYQLLVHIDKFKGFFANSY